MIDKEKSLLECIPPAVEKLIPPAQLMVTNESLNAYSNDILRLEERLKKCPKIGGTEAMKLHPAIFHYFLGGLDIYICEYDGDDLMFGYTILGDLYNSEWGYISLREITSITHLNIDYHFKEQSIENALYERYPDYFDKPEEKVSIFLKLWLFIKKQFIFIYKRIYNLFRK